MQMLFNLIDEHGNRAKTIDEIRMGNRMKPYDPETVDDLTGVIA